jgi:hypothetical protein
MRNTPGTTAGTGRALSRDVQGTAIGQLLGEFDAERPELSHAGRGKPLLQKSEHHRGLITAPIINRNFAWEIGAHADRK